MPKIKVLATLRDQPPVTPVPGDIFLSFTGSTIFVWQRRMPRARDRWIATVSTCEGRRGLHCQTGQSGNWLEAKDFSRRACELGHARALLKKYLPYFIEPHLRALVEINQNFTDGFAVCPEEPEPKDIP